MSTDLWPTDIHAENLLTPEEILAEQAEFLQERTNGLLEAQLKSQPHPGGRVIKFDVFAVRLQSTVRLFDVYQRQDFDYPAAIVVPKESIPDILQGPKRASQLTASVTGMGELLEKAFGNSQETLLAATPEEFRKHIQQVLARPMIKGIVLSLIARSNKSPSA